MTTTNCKKIDYLFIAFLFTVSFALMWYRAKFGVEVTDESYTITDPYLVINGAVPCATLWSQTPLTNLIVVPILRIILAISDGTDGVFLNMAYATVIIRTIFAICIFAALKESIGFLHSSLCALMIYSIVPYSIRIMHYDDLSVLFLALGSVLVFSAKNSESEKKAFIKYCLAGMVMAFCAFAHSLEVCNCIYFAIIILIIDKRIYKRIPMCVGYSLCGICIAASAFFFLEIKGNWNVVSGFLTAYSKNNYFRVAERSHIPLFDNVKILFLNAINTTWIVPVIVCSLLIIHILLFRKKGIKQNKILLLRTSLVGFLVSIAIIGIWFIAQYKTNKMIGDYLSYVCWVTSPFLLIWIDKSHRKAALVVLLALWAPWLCSLSSVMFFAYSDVSSRLWMFSGAAISLIVLSKMALNDVFPKTKNEYTISTSNISCICLSLVFITTMFVNYYSFNYRESAMNSMSYEVSIGPYKGCMTTEDRGKRVEELNRAIIDNTSENETVLFADLFPLGYLMTQAQYLAPCGWDPPQYRYGFQDADIYLTYYDFVGKIPDKIIYINSEGMGLSIDNSANEMTEFVKNNYSLVAQNGEGLFSMRVFQKNEKQ